MTDQSTPSLAARIFPDLPSEANKPTGPSMITPGSHEDQLRRAGQQPQVPLSQAPQSPAHQGQAPQQPQGEQPQQPTFKPSALNASGLSQENYAAEVKQLVGETSDLSDPMTASFVNHAHEQGLSPEQAQKAMAWYEAQAAAHAEQNIAAVRAMPDADIHISAAREVLKSAADPEIMEWLETSGMGNSPQMIRLLSNIRGEMNKLRSQLLNSLRGGNYSPAIFPKR